MFEIVGLLHVFLTVSGSPSRTQVQPPMMHFDSHFESMLLDSIGIYLFLMDYNAIKTAHTFIATGGRHASRGSVHTPIDRSRRNRRARILQKGLRRRGSRP